MQLDQEKRPGDESLTPIDAVIEVAKSDCHDDWARYCDLAVQLAQRKLPTDTSPEAAARQLLARNSKRLLQKYGPVRWNNVTTPPNGLELMDTEARNWEGQFRNRFSALALEKDRDFLSSHLMSASRKSPYHRR